MTEKKDKSETQTKAGMLGKKGSQTEEKDTNTSGKDTGTTPKVSKEKAEGNNEKPLH